ncbi:MAG TPA: adenine deaminase C-terminal domain-containing protein [Nitrososphaerales archaeon]|nr:adenine deaminase C-terminal domain-containing protein [Nitrososphaerales archaeon]
MSGRTSELIAAALGKRKLTLLIKDADLLNVFTGETYETSIGVYKDMIVYVGNVGEAPSALKTIDARGFTAIPGLIETHMHVESSMVTPSRFAEAALPHGLTTAFADPHEIANVMGKAGVKAMVDDSRDLPLKLYFYAPSCVPESKAVTPGAHLTPEDVDEMLGWKGVWGLGEVMNYPAVLNGDRRMSRILESAARRDVVIDGHAPLLAGRELNAYIASGAEADHENFTVESTIEKLRLGMYVKLRGPYVLDTQKFADALKALPHPYNLIFCTDDVMPDNLAHLGHLDYTCRAFLEAGMDPVEVVRSVTLRPALHMRMPHLGAIAPGRVADIVLLKDLKKFTVDLVVANGIPVAKGGRMLVTIRKRALDGPARETMKLTLLGLEDFRVAPPVRNGTVRINTVDFGESSHEDRGQAFAEMILTKLGRSTIEVVDGELSLGDKALVFVFERHGRNGGRSFGFVRNLIRNGALATTVAHDAHNLLVVGTNPEDMRMAANLVIKSRGGIAAVRGKETLAMIRLPIAGLMSDRSLAAVSKDMEGLRRAFKTMGVLDHPYMPLPNLLALSVIPHARITDMGIFDVDGQRFVPAFAD